MKHETARELLVPLLDGELDPGTTELLQRHLANDAGLQRELEQLRTLAVAIKRAEQIVPDADMRTRFAATLAEEKRGLAAAKRSRRGGRRFLDFPLLWQIAAAVVLVCLGVAAGFVFARKDARVRSDGAASVAEVKALREDVNVLRALLVAGPLSDRSASFRLQTMSLAGELAAPEPDVVDALFATLTADESANVRLAALEALARFKNDAAVRRRLVEALPRQSDPFVQIGLINVLVETGAADVREPIERLLFRADVPAVVKSQAQQNLNRL